MFRKQIREIFKRALSGESVPLWVGSTDEARNLRRRLYYERKLAKEDWPELDELTFRIEREAAVGGPARTEALVRVEHRDHRFLHAIGVQNASE